jgi:hypothetical protein
VQVLGLSNRHVRAKTRPSRTHCKITGLSPVMTSLMAYCMGGMAGKEGTPSARWSQACTRFA